MSTEMALVDSSKIITGSVLESLVLYGDISGLTKEQRVTYYTQLCERVGLDPATTPFLPIKLNGKEQLYAGKGCAEQLRKLHNVSIIITSRERIDDLYCVTARATMPNGRTDESIGAVSVGASKGESLANALMKSETKAKRRATLSIVGLGGMLDESEVEDLGADRFGSIPPEQPRAATVVSIAPQPKAEPAPVVVEAQRPEARKSEGLPDTWGPKEALPPAILLWLTPLSHLVDKPIPAMSLAELELVTEQCMYAAERAKESKKPASKQLLALLNAIGAAASRAHFELTNAGGAA